MVGDPGESLVVGLDELGGEELLQAARLVMTSLPPYYEVEGIPEPEMAEAVAACLGERRSETSDGLVLRAATGALGIVTYIPARTLRVARLIGAQGLLKRLSPESVRLFKENLAGYDTGYGPVPSEGLYISRIAVTPEVRGRGLARQLWDAVLASPTCFGDGPRQVSLHVDRANERAIAFYGKLGFVEREQGTRYLTMLWTA